MLVKFMTCVLSTGVLLSFAIADDLPYGQERLPTGVSKSGGLPRQSREEVAIASGWRR